MKNIIRKILKEDRRQIYLDKIVQVMKDDLPLFYNLKDYGFYEQLSEDELIYIFSEIFDQPVKIKGTGVYNKKRKQIYFEDSYGYWVKYEYDENGNKIYYENSNGFWRKNKYDDRGKLMYYEDSDGYIEDER